jgi:hypothetical protein
LPETVPIAENCTVTLSSVPGATMRGCATLSVSVPVEPPVVEELEALEGVEVDMIEDVVEDEATIGIST